MNIKLASLLEKRSQESGRVSIAGVSFRVSGHENRLYLIPETTKDLDLIDSKGGDKAFIQNETFPFLHAVTGREWQWDANNPGAGHIFEIDLDAVIKTLTTMVGRN